MSDDDESQTDHFLYHTARYNEHHKSGRIDGPNEYNKNYLVIVSYFTITYCLQRKSVSVQYGSKLFDSKGHTKISRSSCIFPIIDDKCEMLHSFFHLRLFFAL